MIDFSSARELVSWAREDTKDLEMAGQRFFGANPYTRIREFDVEAGHDVLKLAVPSVPGEMRKLATHAVWDLKHALDHATCSAILAITGKMPEDVTFPFVGHRNALDGRLLASNKRHPNGKYPAELLPLLRRFEPYPRSDGLPDGSDELCAISRMANTSKHSVALSARPSLSINALRTSSAFIRLFPRYWDGERQELIVGHIWPNTNFDMELEIDSYVSFSDFEPFQPYPAVHVLNEVAKAVDGMIDDFEAEVTAIVAAKA